MPVAGLHGLPSLAVHTSPLFLTVESFSHIIRYAFSVGNAGLRHKQFVPERVAFEPAGQMYSGQYDVAAASVNFDNGNLQVLPSVGGSTITLSNMKDGGSYVLVVTDPTLRTYTFSGCTSPKFNPANGSTVASTTTIYNILKVTISGTAKCYITWSTGY